MKDYPFIDAKMSLEEVRVLLEKTVFSPENKRRIETKVDRDSLKYKRKHLRWLESCTDELYQIFDPIKVEDSYPIKLIGIPYFSKNNNQGHIMFFSAVRVKKGWLIAALIEDEIEFFTMHSIDGFEQRKDANLYQTRLLKNIGKMLINNNMSWVCNYNENGFSATYDIVRDGMYICTNENGIWLKKTFVTTDMFRPEQRRFYNTQVSCLNEHLKDRGIPLIGMVA